MTPESRRDLQYAGCPRTRGAPEGRDALPTDTFTTPARCVLTRSAHQLEGSAFLARQVGGSPEQWQIKPLGRGRLNSRVYRAFNTATSLVVLLKRTESDDPRHGAQAQAQALSAAGSRLGDEGPARVPKLLGVDAQGGWIAQQWIDGTVAAHVLQQAPLKEAEATGAACGAWLARFGTDAGELAFDAAQRLADLEEARAGQQVPASLAEAYAQLRRNADRVAAYRVPLAWVHGDFKAANLIVGAHALWGIDLGPAQRNSSLIDPASFLNDLHLCLPADRAQSIEAAFLTAHGETTPAVALDWLRLQMLLERYFERPGPWLQRIRHGFLRPRLAQLARKIATRF